MGYNKGKLDQLLDEVSSLLDKRKNQIDAGCNDYSLLKSVHKVSDEVKLHSGFIYSMINPASAHYMGTLFLEWFMRDAIGVTEFSYETAEVYKEVCLDDKESRIDLFITDGDRFYVIENKIHASDQPGQIERYIASVQKKFGVTSDDAKERIFVYYLTKEGGLPTKESLGCFWLDDGEILNATQCCEGAVIDIRVKLNLISYEVNITKWVERCLQSPSSANIEYAFREYHDVLMRLLRKRKNNVSSIENMLVSMATPKADTEDTFDVSKFKLAAEVGEAWVGVKAQVLSLFFEGLVEVANRLGGNVVECNELGGGHAPSDMEDWLTRCSQKWRYKGVCFNLDSSGGQMIAVFLADKFLHVGLIGCEVGVTPAYESRSWKRFKGLNYSKVMSKNNFRVFDGGVIEWILGRGIDEMSVELKHVFDHITAK